METPCRVIRKLGPKQNNDFERISRSDPDEEISVRIIEISSVSIGDTFTRVRDSKVWRVDGINENTGRTIKSAVL